MTAINCSDSNRGCCWRKSRALWREGRKQGRIPTLENFAVTLTSEHSVDFLLWCKFFSLIPKRKRGREGERERNNGENLYIMILMLLCDQHSRLFLCAECTLFFLNALVAFNQSHISDSLLPSLLSSAATSLFLRWHFFLKMFSSSLLCSSSSPLLHLYIPPHSKLTWQRVI